MTTSPRNLRNFFLLFSSMLIVIGGLTIAPGIASMSEHYSHLPNSALLVKLVVTLPSLMIALSSFFIGYLSDQWGRRPILLIASLTCAFAGTAGLYLDNLYLILFSRAILGLAITGMMVCTSAIISDVFEGRARQQFYSYQGFAVNFAGILFLGLGGILADIHWRAPYVIYSMGLFVFIGIVVFIKETGGRKHRQSLIKENNHDEMPIGEEQSTWLLLSPIYLIMMVLAIAAFLFPIMLPFVFQELSLSMTRVGFALAWMSVFGAISSFGFQYIIRKLGNLLTLIFIILNLSIAFMIIGNTGNFYLILFGLIFSGITVGIAMLWGINITTSIIDPKKMGAGIGVVTSFFFFGNFLSPIAAAPFLNYFSYSEVFAIYGYIFLGFGLCLIAYKVIASLKSRRAIE